MKHLANSTIACALLIFTLPLIAFVALVLKCHSHGPVFERCQRLGANGRRFDMLTFRTTEYDPDENPMPSWARQPTALGSVLRYTRIDALPRLINAMHGDLSLFEAHGRPDLLWD
jgi:lipopolysaccharide/colanic/teichoic acid biosynthesis glycosyltransferase